MRFQGAKYAQNAIAVGALSQTPLGELTASQGPNPIDGFKGAYC